MRTRGQDIAWDAIHEGMTEEEIAAAIDLAIAECKADAKSSCTHQPDDSSYKSLSVRIDDEIAKFCKGIGLKLTHPHNTPENIRWFMAMNIAKALPERESIGEDEAIKVMLSDWEPTRVVEASIKELMADAFESLKQAGYDIRRRG